MTYYRLFMVAVDVVLVVSAFVKLLEHFYAPDSLLWLVAFLYLMDEVAKNVEKLLRGE